MASHDPHLPPRRAPRSGGVLAAALLLALSACTPAEEGPPEPTTTPSPTGTPLAEVDTSTMVLTRAAFCQEIPDESVTLALGGTARKRTSYDNGERAQLTDDVRDVAHEFDCTFRRGATEARAWLFAPPVTRARAKELVALAAEAKGCETPDAAPDYGRPSLASVCSDDERTTVLFRGLFHDSWLTCSLAVPTAGTGRQAELLDRAGRWCAAVAQAASGDDA